MAPKRNKGGRKTRMSDETVRAPAAGGVIQRTPGIPPRIRSTTIGTRVSNTELLAGVNVAAAGAFSVVGAGLFPSNLGWLNGIASNYSKFRWLSIKLIYIPIVPTTTAGAMTMALSYDPADATPTSFQQVQQMYNSITAPVWAGFDGATVQLLGDCPTTGAVCIDVDVNRFGFTWYRYATLAAITALTANDRNLYIPSVCNVATSGGSAATNVGNLMIKYSIELIEPIPAAIN
uniref:Capsid protein n=1 Tax=Beet black scorch virus TaxID=196375 RepID=A0A4D6DRN8_9TOMB|nr:coat protein [Beet black scorch virus]QBZ68818.1 coat protein [Beet black scorch virus]QBZ68828.1 coat protein [Beet black scorch virus]